MKVKIIYGCPCSGKSTYVRDHAGDSDVVYDYDALLEACTTRQEHLTSKHAAHKMILKLRYSMVSFAKEEDAVENFWLMCRWPNDSIRGIVDGLESEEIYVQATKEECYERLMGDDTRPDKDEWKQVIDDWFAEHEPEDQKSKGATVMSGTRKSFTASPIRADAEKDIDLINQYSLKELKPEDVYCFSVALCDNEVDRDMERFTDEGLNALAKMFVGKTGIKNHVWDTNNQVARIYRAEVQETGQMTSYGAPYKRLMGSAYMLNNEANKDLIESIEGGITKEVSVGFAHKKTLCSICGNRLDFSWDTYQVKCKNDHVKGGEYDGQKCVGLMEDLCDAYEFSFVAVPSQRGAGVAKSFDASGEEVLKMVVKLSPDELAENIEALDAVISHLLSAKQSREDREARKKILEENDTVIKFFEKENI